jgi:hypothetical protein
MFGPRELCSVKLEPSWEKSASWARVMSGGVLELELYDYSDEANQSLGNDVAWIWRISAEDTARAAWKLGVKKKDWEGLLEAIRVRFGKVHPARDWLKAEGFAVEEKFDSWA